MKSNNFFVKLVSILILFLFLIENSTMINVKSQEQVKSPDIPSGIDYDNNNDGQIDNVAFICSSEVDNDRNLLLWPHKSTYDGSENLINGIICNR